MEPAIPGVVWYGYELQQLFPEAVGLVAAEERFEGLTVDSRRPVPGGIFVALRGRSLDAHTKLPEAFAKGASLALVEQALWRHAPADWQVYRCLPVVSPRRALGELARRHRERFRLPVIAVAGSAGKTTTKELIAAVLQKRFRVLKTPENENNQLGVPLTLLRLGLEHEVAVIELGTNSFGEIARLCQIVQPTHGVVTALGEEHLEFFGSLAGVVREETALVRFLRARNGGVILPAEEALLEPQPGEVTFGTLPEATVWAEASVGEEGYPFIRLHYGAEVRSCQLRIPGSAGVRAAVAAAAVAWMLGLDADSVVAALSEAVPQSSGHGYGRMVLLEFLPGVRVLNDTYNANPLSMRVALETLRLLPCRRWRWAVLGDMRELGHATEEAHRRVLEQAQRSADVVCVLGQAFAAVAPAYPAVRVFCSHEELAEYLRQRVQAGDVVLLKGSRALAMERILQLWRDNRGEHSHAVPSGTLDMENV